MPFVVALTGGIGSGKTAVSDLLARHGADVVDTDVIARELTGPAGGAIDAIRATFGTRFIAPDGSLDRARMRELAFEDSSAKRKLEAILHPLIRARSKALVNASRGPYVVLVVPLLVESGNYRGRADRVLVVDCPVEAQIERTMRRSGLERDQVERIIASQTTRETRLAAADDVIDNTAGLDALEHRVAELHERYLAAARNKNRPASKAS